MQDALATKAVAYIADRAVGPPLDPTLRTNLHFHPDRIVGGKPILEAMSRSGVYLSQFATGTSNGGLTAHPGGDRWHWESRIFGGIYDASSPPERPKYGALNFRRRSTGASPRFGSAYFRLSPVAHERTTFCYPDSVYQPQHFGVAARMGLIPLAESHAGDPLDAYIEAQVHGPLHLSSDVEALVLDPSFRGTDVESLANRLPVSVQWHDGFHVECNVLRRHPDYRGRAIVDLALAISRDGALTPALIGNASHSGTHDEQSLKRVWHSLACFGDRALTIGSQ